MDYEKVELKMESDIVCRSASTKLMALSTITMTDNEMRNMLLDLRVQLIHFLGGGLPLLCPCVLQAIRSHLNVNYCHTCGEYIEYNLARKKHIKHLHSNGKYKLWRKEQFTPLFLQRIHINPDLMIIEWKRRFPRIQHLPPLDCSSLQHPYRTLVRKIPSIRVWNMEEWNLLYPELSINRHDVASFKKKLCDWNFIPDLTLE